MAGVARRGAGGLKEFLRIFATCITIICALAGAYGLPLVYGKSYWWSAVPIALVAIHFFRVADTKEKAEHALVRAAKAQQEHDTAKVQLDETREKLEIERFIANKLGSKRQSEAIAAVADRSLEEKLNAAIFVGHRDDETQEEWDERRRELVQARARLWRTRNERYGASLLDLVEQQGGLCGDPRKDPQLHGCGCWLLAMPPGTVHIDHIYPRAEGGSDDPSNLQVLCQSCNLVKGRKVVRERPQASRRLWDGDVL